MKFIVSSSLLLKKLQVLGGIINSNNTLPILDHFLFSLESSSLTISASDLETTISSTLEVESNEGGSVCVPARLLLDTLKTFPEQPLTFTVEDNHTIEISSNHGKYALAYANGFNTPEYFWDPLIQASVLGQLGNYEEAGNAVDELLALVPDFETRGRSLIHRMVYLEGNTKMLIEGLAKAGLGVV